MALNADALTTVEKAALYLARTGAGNEQTEAELDDADFVELLVNSYSRAIRNYTLREFVPKVPASDTDPVVERLFAYAGDGYLSLAPYELREVTSVVLFSDQPAASQLTLAAETASAPAEYRLGPRQKTPEGTWLWISLPYVTSTRTLLPVGNGGNPYASCYQTEVAITGRWGVGSVPADVELACLIAVANAYRNPEAFGSRSLGELGFSEQPEPFGADSESHSLPRDARALLSPYRRRGAKLITV